MNIFIARHGHVFFNPPYEDKSGRIVLEGYEASDPSLSVRGRMQAERLGAYLSSVRIDSVLCSPFQRTVETAYCAVQTQKNPPVIELWNGLIEVGGENDEYIPLDLLKTKYPNIKLMKGCHDCFEPLPGDDPEKSDELLIERAKAVKSYITGRFSGNDNVLLVTHGLFNGKYLLPVLLGIPDAWKSGVYFCTENAALSRIRYHKGKSELVFLNNVSYQEDCSSMGNILLDYE
ncbi:MAG: histidine phosphatase family protein [Firmicutes bacterium]|nr:histidine phosphatase family protein [Bacillota bacterium]